LGTIAERIKLLRESRGLTGEALANMAGIRASTISLLETETRTDPHSTTLAAIAEALETTTDYLVGLTDCPTRNTREDESVDENLQAIIAAWPFLSDEARAAVAEMARLLGPGL
jgi:transcriptional regulator with XRE-family HTH domain